MTNLTVYKSNKVIEAAYKLSLNEQKIILTCIAKHDSRKPLTTDDVFEVTAKEFAELTGIDENNAYRALIEVAESLFSRYVVINNPVTIPKAKKIKTRWISTIAYMHESGALSLRFSYDMLPYLSELKEKFTKYELKNIGGMSSKYGIRLYELLTQYRSYGRRELEIEWIRSNFEIGDAYKATKDFKARVIDKAIDDINEHSDLKVQPPIYSKTGRSVTHVTFDFKEKSKPKSQKTKQATKAIQAAPPIDNVEHYADLLKRAGGDARQAIINTIPFEVKQTLINRGIL